MTENYEMPRKINPMHPGEVLREEFMQPLSLSAYALARALGVPRTRIERTAAETIGISADTALRLAKYFGTSAEFWLNLQARYDVLTAEKSLAGELKKIAPHRGAAQAA